jgi:CRP-like cAMP-binding protein
MAAAIAIAYTTQAGQLVPFVTASKLGERAALMCSSPLFTGLSMSECEKIAAHARPRSFAPDELLFMQGDLARNLFLIRSGSVKISQLSQNGNEVILWMYGSGNVIGLLPEPASRRHTSSARVMEHCTALAWDYETVQSMVEEYPQIGKNMNQILAGRLGELEERFREVATEKVPKRLALALLRLRNNIGKEVRGGVEVSLSREELALMTGTTMFTISRILSQWSREKFVSSHRQSVLVRDPRRLELVADEI